MTDPDTLPDLDVINDAVLKLQKSARRTIPMFFVGILATLIAAGVALFYIITLSTNLREARRALQQSQVALVQARADLALVSATLRQSPKTISTAAGAGTIANVLSDVARSQNNIEVASSSISSATTQLTPDAGGTGESPPVPNSGSCLLVVKSVTYLKGSCGI